MPNFKFICEHRDFHTYDVDSKTIVETNKESLYDVIEEFERFLRGAGFVFEGQLDIVNEKEELEHSFVTKEDISLWSQSYTAGDMDLTISDSDFVIGNLDYLSEIDFRYDPSAGNLEEIKIETTPVSSVWPFPANERPL